jgi:hypothetical protein
MRNVTHKDNNLINGIDELAREMSSYGTHQNDASSFIRGVASVVRRP